MATKNARSSVTSKRKVFKISNFFCLEVLRINLPDLIYYYINQKDYFVSIGLKIKPITNH